MFKYISEILAQFSDAQKIIALILLLLTISIITIAPKVIQDTDDLKEVVTEQEHEIGNLREDIVTLNDNLRKSQIDCTNRILKREQEIIDYIETIQERFESMNNDNLIQEESDDKRTEPVILEMNTKDPSEQAFESLEDLKDKIKSNH